jgi:transposase
MLYVGLDVHRRRTQVSVMDEDGHELFNRNVPNDPERLADVLCGAEPGTPVAFESAYGWGWLAELLEDMGLEPHLAHAKSCKAITHARLKNDRVDARILAHLLRADLLPEAWIAPRPVKELRMVLRHRAALVRQRTVMKSRVRAVLADRGIDAPEALWDRPGRQWLAQVDLPSVEREVIDDLCDLIDATQTPIARLERQIRGLAKPDPRVDALQHLPGIGLLTAMTLVAEIGDINRFPDARKLCAWSGMTPKVRNSDATVHHGRITKQGPAAVRAVLVEAAQTAKLRPPFADVYESIRRRRGKQIATVAIARRMLAQSFHILQEVNQKIATGEADRCAG